MLAQPHRSNVAPALPHVLYRSLGSRRAVGRAVTVGPYGRIATTGAPVRVADVAKARRRTDPPRRTSKYLAPAMSDRLEHRFVGARWCDCSYAVRGVDGPDR